MPAIPNLNVSLTPHLERFVARLFASGRYQSASEVERAGLRRLERFESGTLHMPGDIAGTPQKPGCTMTGDMDLPQTARAAWPRQPG